MRGAPIRYSDAELFWIRDNRHRPRAEAHAEFVEIWNRPDVGLDNYKSLCTRRGWTTGRTGRFAPGQTSWNKGKPMPAHPNSRRTQFKPGERHGVANTLYKPIGTERISKNGYLERKIHDGQPLQSRWRAVHLIRWEAANGPVPDGHCLKCLDGDRLNTDPSNWRAIPRGMLPRLAGRWQQGYDTAAPELRPTIMATAELAHATRQARKKAP